MKKIMMMMCVALCAMAFTNLHQDHFKVDTKKSSLKWIGSKVTGTHQGGISIKEGTISLEHGELVGAQFTVDMTTITNTDIESEEYSQKLENHLKAEDFFDVGNHPAATFKMATATKTENGYMVNGNLTIKEHTQEISFELAIQQRGNSLIANGTMVFDRTQFDIIYGSGTFFGDLGDRAISNDISIEFNVIAENKSNGKRN
tara:strand:- start:104 stop:709 length:606 start_codon:yes stop_codon:yes gene_type:complete